MRTRELTAQQQQTSHASCHARPIRYSSLLSLVGAGEGRRSHPAVWTPSARASVHAAIRLLAQREGCRSSSAAERCVELVAVHSNRDGARHGIFRIVKIAREPVGANARQRRGLRNANRSGRTLGAHAKGIARLPSKGRPASRTFCSSGRECNSTAATPGPIEARLLAVSRKRETDGHCRCQKSASDADREPCPSHAGALA